MSMKKQSIPFLTLISFSCAIFAANPNATYQEAFYDSQTSGSGSPGEVFLFLIYIGSIIIGGWLLFSGKSPIRDWAEKNRTWALWLIILGVPVILSAFR